MDKTQLNLLDEELKQLALLAQQGPQVSQAKQGALRQLINQIMHSGRLCRPQSGQFFGVYEDIYDEAIQDLLLYICKNIEKYDPEKGSVMAWVNVLLDRRFFREAIPKVLGQPKYQKVSISDIEEIHSDEKAPSLTDLLKECLESDPMNLFQREHIEHHPSANFQALALARMAGKSWKEIAEELGLKVSTVSSFYCRCIAKFSDPLRTYCSEHRV